MPLKEMAQISNIIGTKSARQCYDFYTLQIANGNIRNKRHQWTQ